MHQFLSVYYFTLLLLHVSATACHPQGARLYSSFGTWWHIDAQGRGELRVNSGMEWVTQLLERERQVIACPYTTTLPSSAWVSWHPRRFEWTAPFHSKTKTSLCAIDVTFRTSYTFCVTRQFEFLVDNILCSMWLCLHKTTYYTEFYQPKSQTVM
jgi:hypothetical protein